MNQKENENIGISKELSLGLLGKISKDLLIQY